MHFLRASSACAIPPLRYAGSAAGKLTDFNHSSTALARGGSYCPAMPRASGLAGSLAFVRRRHALSALLLPLTLSACLGPRYHHPDIPPPAEWSTPASPQAPEWPENGWWHGFGSQDLDSFIAQAQAANDDLRAAIARVREADAQRRIAGAPLLPAVGLSASATRARAPVIG